MIESQPAERELDILRLMRFGWSYGEIASELRISIHTVHGNVKRTRVRFSALDRRNRHIDTSVGLIHALIVDRILPPILPWRPDNRRVSP